MGKFLDAAGPNAVFVSQHGGPHVFAEAFASFLGSGYRAKLVEYPTFDLRLMKRCIQRTTASVFGSLDPSSKTKFVVGLLKGGGELGLDGVLSRIAKGHRNERPLHARPRQCRGDYRWGMATSGILPEKDWPQI